MQKTSPKGNPQMTQAETDNRFVYHRQFGDQPQRYEALRAKAKELAELANRCCPNSREKSHGFTQLEDAVMWFNASIARSEKEDTRSKQCKEQ